MQGDKENTARRTAAVNSVTRLYTLLRSNGSQLSPPASEALPCQPHSEARPPSQAPDLTFPPCPQPFIPTTLFSSCLVPRCQHSCWTPLACSCLRQRLVSSQPNTTLPISLGPTSAQLLTHGPSGPAPAPVPSAWDSQQAPGNLNTPPAQLHQTQPSGSSAWNRAKGRALRSPSPFPSASLKGPVGLELSTVHSLHTDHLPQTGSTRD